jgi:hypothetical protein
MDDNRLTQNELFFVTENAGRDFAQEIMTLSLISSKLMEHCYIPGDDQRAAIERFELVQDICEAVSENLQQILKIATDLGHFDFITRKIAKGTDEK